MASTSSLFRVNGYEFPFSIQSAEYAKNLAFIYTAYLKSNTPLTRTAYLVLDRYPIGEPRRLESHEDPGLFIPDLDKLIKDPRTPRGFRAFPIVDVYTQLIVNFFAQLYLIYVPHLDKCNVFYQSHL